MSKNNRYKNSNKKIVLSKEAKKIIGAILIFLIIIIILNSILSFLENKENENKRQEESISKFSSIKEILEKYGSTYLKEEKSKDSKYSVIIYAKLKYNTFEEENSKQVFYENLISELGTFLNNGFILIDETKSLTIDVLKNNGIYYYRINGEENYFQNQKSKLTLKNYEESNLTNFQINTNIIMDLINNSWKKNTVNYGTKDSDFNKYEIYFEEGIEVRNIQNQVYNVVFTKKFAGEVIDGIRPGEDLNNVVKKLGSPTFGSIEEGLVGFKSEDIYIFFSQDEISIYRNEKPSIQMFENYLEKYINKDISLKEFTNKLTDIWPDYEEYTYDESMIYLNYPGKGVVINMNSDNSLGVQIYNNYPISDKITQFINENKITGKLNDNLIFKYENDRLFRKYELEYLCYTQQNIENIESTSKIYDYYIEGNNVNFISKDESIPNKTVNIEADEAFWFTDTILIFNKHKKGIYYYNVDMNIVSTIIEGTENFSFSGFEDGVLTYDETKQINISN